HEIDERASDYFAVLLMASKNKNIWKPSGRLLTYIKSSKRTQKYKKVELKKAAQNIWSITTYLAPALMTSTFESSMESIEIESIEVELIGMESAEIELIEVELTADLFAKIDLDERTKMRLVIEKLERTLKKDDNQIDKGIKGDYKAQCIGAWAQNGENFQKRTVSHFEQIMSYLRSYKFSMNPKILKNYVENEVFLSLGIERKKTICEKTAWRWLKKLGWYCKEWKKDIYELEPVLVEYDDKDLSKLVEKDISPEQKQHCVITHDKTILNANDDKKQDGGPKVNTKYVQKGRAGASIAVRN
ncbi:26002_t:CDS:2, partial [Racocetra persica]